MNDEGLGKGMEDVLKDFKVGLRKNIIKMKGIDEGCEDIVEKMEDEKRNMEDEIEIEKKMVVDLEEEEVMEIMEIDEWEGDWIMIIEERIEEGRIRKKRDKGELKEWK